VVRCGILRMDTKRHVDLEEIGLYACSKYVDHNRLDSQHKGGGLYNHLISSMMICMPIIE
jgi:hypothetical protein